MKADELVILRHKWRLTQEELARRLGLGRRALIELEMGRRPIRRSHVLALERISLDMSIIHNDMTMLMPNVRYAVNYVASEPEARR